ncbi:unnamed protein product [Phaedon cochleariae]|uniref:Zinc finger MYM-type protein 1 n=1 Tax=Phaedon cochleariae TaxID=80249 RepID=A0A9N9SH28_PHACE|nr:unnamed protein product [Phaedon cochleariae]
MGSSSDEKGLVSRNEQSAKCLVDNVTISERDNEQSAQLLEDITMISGNQDRAIIEEPHHSNSSSSKPSNSSSSSSSASESDASSSSEDCEDLINDKLYTPESDDSEEDSDKVSDETQQNDSSNTIEETGDIEETCQPSTSQNTNVRKNIRDGLQERNNESTSSHTAEGNDFGDDICYSITSEDINENRENLEHCDEFITYVKLDKTSERYKDLAFWPDSVDNDLIRLYLVKDFTYFQNYDHNNYYPQSETAFGKQKRCFNNLYFARTLKNGQKIKRQWLCYSPSSGLVYCIACKLFSLAESKFKTGLNDWPNILRLLDMHQLSKGHTQSILTWFSRKENKNTIDKHMEEQAKKESDHFYQDLSLHQRDSTPDLDHIDQLAIVVRYCFQGLPYERVLTFIPIERHTSEYLFEQISSFLSQTGIPLENIRGQSYDNAANMSGTYNGVQARFKSINRFADYIPCSAHSLNLVGAEAVKLIPEVVDYFGILQLLYVFFSASPHRWNKVSTIAKLQYLLKSLSLTRWCAHYEAVRALKFGYDDILKTSKHIYLDETEKTDCRNEAKKLYKKLIKLEYAMLTVIWERVLERFNKVSTKLQNPSLNIQEAYYLMDSSKLLIQDIRGRTESETDQLETNAKELSEDIEKEYEGYYERKRKILLANKEIEKPVFIGKDKFRYLYEWKSKTKKARLNYSAIMQTGGGGYICKDLTDLENRLMALFGWINIIGCPGAPAEVDPDAELVENVIIEVTENELFEGLGTTSRPRDVLEPTPQNNQSLLDTPVPPLTPTSFQQPPPPMVVTTDLIDLTDEPAEVSSEPRTQKASDDSASQGPSGTYQEVLASFMSHQNVGDAPIPCYSKPRVSFPDEIFPPSSPNETSRRVQCNNSTRLVDLTMDPSVALQQRFNNLQMSPIIPNDKLICAAVAKCECRDDGCSRTFERGKWRLVYRTKKTGTRRLIVAQEGYAIEAVCRRVRPSLLGNCIADTASFGLKLCIELLTIVRGLYVVRQEILCGQSRICLWPVRWIVVRYGCERSTPSRYSNVKVLLHKYSKIMDIRNFFNMKSSCDFEDNPDSGSPPKKRNKSTDEDLTIFQEERERMVVADALVASCSYSTNREEQEEITEGTNDLGNYIGLQQYLYEWKSKTKKARLNYSAIMQTGGGGYICKDLTDLENRLMAFFGWINIIGCPGAPAEVDPDAELVENVIIEVTENECAIPKIAHRKKKINSSKKLENSAILYSESTQQMVLAVKEMAAAISQLADAISKIASALNKESS